MQIKIKLNSFTNEKGVKSQEYTHILNWHVQREQSDIPCVDTHASL